MSEVDELNMGLFTVLGKPKELKHELLKMLQIEKKIYATKEEEHKTAGRNVFASLVYKCYMEMNIAKGMCFVLIWFMRNIHMQSNRHMR